MKKFKWIVFLLILCAALSFLTPVGAQASELNFGPITVSSGTSSGVNTSMESPICHDSAQDCDSFKIVDIMRNTFDENKLVPQGEWLENKLSETRKEITAEGCNKFSMEDALDSIVADHVEYCKTTANPHFQAEPESFIDNGIVGNLSLMEQEIKGIMESIMESRIDAKIGLPIIKTITQSIPSSPSYLVSDYVLDHSDYIAYSNNCISTSLSYAMCRQGYDVQAHAYRGNHTQMFDQERLYTILKGNFYESNMIAEIIDLQFNLNRSHPNLKEGYYTREEGLTTLETIEKKMAEWEDGTVIIIGIKWKLGSGHAFNAEKINGKVVFIDPQNPERSDEFLRNKLRKNIDESESFFFTTNDIDFSKKLDELTLWVDEKEVVENTKY